jgi:hypothetical protein
MPVDGSLYLLPGLIAEVTYTVLSHATGDDQARPSTSTLHFTFCFVDQAVGSVPSASTPAPAGPRNCGHATDGTEKTATDDADDTDRKTKTARSNRRIPVR